MKRGEESRENDLRHTIHHATRPDGGVRGSRTDDFLTRYLARVYRWNYGEQPDEDDDHRQDPARN